MYVDLKNINHAEGKKVIKDFDGINDTKNYSVENKEDVVDNLLAVLRKKEEEIKTSRNIDINQLIGNTEPLKVNAFAKEPADVSESLNIFESACYDEDDCLILEQSPTPTTSGNQPPKDATGSIAKSFPNKIRSRFKNTTSVAVLGDIELTNKFKKLDLAHVDNAKVAAMFKANPKLKERASALVNKYKVAEIQLSAQRIYGIDDRDRAWGQKHNLIISDHDKVALENM